MKYRKNTCRLLLPVLLAGCAHIPDVSDLTAAGLVGQKQARLQQLVDDMRPMGLVICVRQPFFDTDPRLHGLTDGSSREVAVYGCGQRRDTFFKMTCRRVLVVAQYGTILFVSRPEEENRWAALDDVRFCRSQ